MSESKRNLRPSQRLCRISARTGKIIDEAAITPPPPKAKGKSDSVFHAAERAAEFYDHLRAHYRESKRVPVEIEASIKVLLLDGTVCDAGSAVVLNVSPSGALLGKVRLTRGQWPVQPFKLEMIMKSGDYEGIGIEAKPMRFEHAFGGIGVKFEEIFVAV
jgi:hypothetical protein